MNATDRMIDPKTGDYVSSGGAPVKTTSVLPAAYRNMRMHQGEWMYWPEGGSRFHTLQKHRTTSTDDRKIEAMAVQSLKPMIDDGRADSVSCTILRSSRSSVGMQTRIAVGQEAPQVLNLDSIGV